MITLKLNEARLHLLFKVGVVIKGIDGALEILAGIAFCFTSTAALRHLVDALTQGELQEDPNDFIANHLVNFFHQLSVGTEHFAAAYLIIYGVTKVGLAVGLLRGKLWAYPAALVILGALLCYQIYRFSHNHSLGLASVSLVDFAILIVIWRDYQMLKARRYRIVRPGSGDGTSAT